MIKRLVYILFCLCVVLSAAAKDTYNLDDLISGADAFGRGGAYLAADDSSSYVFQNYSLLGRQEAPRLTLTVFKLISEINYLAAAYSQGNWGLGVMHIGDNGGYVRDESNHIIGGQIGYNNTTLYGTYGRQLRDDLFLGARLKYHNVVFSEVDSQASGLAFDLNGLYQPSEYLLLGSELNNLIASPLTWTDGTVEKQPFGLRLGSKLKIAGEQGLFFDTTQPVDLYTDVLFGANSALCGGGLEYWPSQYLALRVGAKQTASILKDNSYSPFTRFTAGVGFNWHNIYIDYAYNPGDELADNLTHFFTLSYRFAEQPKPEPEPEVIEEEEVVEVRPPRPPRSRMFVDLNKLPMTEQALIEDLGYLGLVEGYPGRVYIPQQSITKRELLIILVRLLELENRSVETAPLSFSDIATRDIKVAEKAFGYGFLFSDPENGLTYMEDPIHINEALRVFARYYEIAEQEMPSDTIGFFHRGYLRRRDAAKIFGRIQHIKETRATLPPLKGFTEEQWQELLPYESLFGFF